MISDTSEVLVRRQHCEFVAYAQLSKERIDRSDLHTMSPAKISQLSRPDMIVTVRHHQGQRRKSAENLFATLGSREAVKQLLKHEARRQQRLTAFNRLDQRPDFSACSGRIAPQCE